MTLTADKIDVALTRIQKNLERVQAATLVPLESPRAVPRPAGFLPWLTLARSAIQTELLCLDALLRDVQHHHKFISEGPERRIISSLIGAGFSLWRAVFQAYNSLATEENVKAAMHFLGKVIATNAINFQDELNSWSFGYYVNNSNYRLALAIQELADVTRENPFAVEFQELQTALRTSTRDSYEAWDYSFEVFKKIADRLSALLA